MIGARTESKRQDTENRYLIDFPKTDKIPNTYKGRFGGTYEVHKKSGNLSLLTSTWQKNSREKING